MPVFASFHAFNRSIKLPHDLKLIVLRASEYFPCFGLVEFFSNRVRIIPSAASVAFDTGMSSGISRYIDVFSSL